MPSLGDFFPDDLKKNFAKQNITIGTVIKCFVKNTNPPKEKRFVVLGIDANGDLIGVVFINSVINWKVIKTDELAQLQHYVTKEDNEYLDRNSYIDCSELFELPYNDVYTSIQSKPQNVLGSVIGDDLKTIKENVKKSPKIKPKLLKKYKLA
jgi:hypothetical protein